MSEREFYEHSITEIAKCSKCGKTYPLRPHTSALCECGTLHVGHIVRRESVERDQKQRWEWFNKKVEEEIGQPFKKKGPDEKQYTSKELITMAKVVIDSMASGDPRRDLMYDLYAQIEILEHRVRLQTGEAKMVQFMTCVMFLGILGLCAAIVCLQAGI